MKLKRIVAIHDISGVGKCSLTAVLPIVSAAGVECSCLPTAVLSTHTGGFEGFTFRDLTDDLLPVAEHWKREGVVFDALYSGYLGSLAQIGVVREIFDMFRGDGALVLVDPVMADNGKLYSLFTHEHVKGMRELCGCADIIVPNRTEAAFMLGALTRGRELAGAVRIAVDYTREAIRLTAEDKTDPRMGVRFESVLPDYGSELRGCQV
jgi:pyridoxine kinase